MSKRLPFVLACANLNEEVIDLMIEMGFNINARDSDMMTPLIAACETQGLEIIKKIIENGADIGAVDKEGGNAITHACYGQNINVINFLLESGANINPSLSPLIIACASRESDIISFLLSKGANIDAVGEHGNTPLIQAIIKRRQLEIIKLLVGFGANLNLVDNYGRTALILSCIKHDLPEVRLLVENGALVNYINEKGESPLIESCRATHYRDLEIVELLIKFGAVVNLADNRYDSPLLAACRSENFGVIEILVNFGADVNYINQSGDTPLKVSFLKENYEIFEYLIEMGADNYNPYPNNETEYWPIHSAVINGDYYSVICMLNNGIDVNQVSAIRNTTALHLAIENEDLKMINLLVERGADIYIERVAYDDEYPFSPFDLVTEKYQNMKMFNIIERAKNYDPYYTLDRGVPREFLIHVLSAGIDLNKQDEEGKTPLHRAVFRGDIQLVKLLLLFGADTKIIDREGKMPIDYVWHNSEMKDILSD